MADYDPANIGDSWTGDARFDGEDSEQTGHLEDSTEQEEQEEEQEPEQDQDQANYSLQQSTRAPGDFPSEDGATEDVGDYDPASVTTSLPESAAPTAQTHGQSPLKPSPQPATKKPRAVGGFLVGDSDSEEDGEPPAPAARAIPAAKSRASIPPSPLQNTVTLNPAGGSASNTPAIQANGPLRVPTADNVSATVVAGAASRPSLPYDKIKHYEDRVRDDPRGAVTEWLSLMAEHRARNNFAEARQVFDRFLALFPQAVSNVPRDPLQPSILANFVQADVWVSYLEMELNMGNFSEAEAIFGRCLMDTPNVGLWTTYLDYIRRRNDVNDGSGQARNVVSDSYKFVIDNIGLDKDSGKIWSDYIQFIKSGPGKVGGSDWQDQQKMDQLRKAYQQATAVPIDNVNTLWKEYDQFEMNLNKLTGRKYLAERSPSYMSAKSAVTALKNITQGLQRTTIPRLPPATGFEGDQEFTDQVAIWTRWIAWEKSDPLDLRDDQPDILQKRIVYIYNQALMALRFWPDMWAEASQWCIENNITKLEKPLGVDYLDRGIKANPESVLLAFKLGEYIEATHSVDETVEGKVAKGDAVRQPYQQVLDTLYGLTKAVKDRELATIAIIEEAAATELASLAAQEKNADDDDEEEYSLKLEREAREKLTKEQVAAIQQGNNAQLQLLSKTISFVWIALMRAMRRVQGKGDPKKAPGGMRQIFQEARQRGRLTSEVYVASAQMEWLIYHDPVGKKIFDRGAKLFPEDENFTLEYIKHLHSVADPTSKCLHLKAPCWRPCRQ
jgi:cleavage stimulation factor subunit 3